jgi:hypothetical protein
MGYRCQADRFGAELSYRARFCALTPATVALMRHARLERMRLPSSRPRHMTVLSYSIIVPLKAAPLRRATLPWPSGRGKTSFEGGREHNMTKSPEPTDARRAPEAASVAAALPPLRSTRMLDQLRERVRTLHFSRSTEQAYVQWCRAFIRFHGIRHPAQMARPKSSRF